MKSFFSHVLIFAAGLCFGLAVAHSFHQQAMDRLLADPFAALDRLFSEQLIDTLDLTPDKKTEALRLTGNAAQDIKSCRERHRPEFREILLNLGKKLKNLAKQSHEKPIDHFIERLIP